MVPGCSQIKEKLIQDLKCGDEALGNIFQRPLLWTDL